MRIKNIQPVTIWSEGEFVNVVKLGVKISDDDMIEKAVFQYSLYTDKNVPLTGGYINIDGEDYHNWGYTGDANQEAMIWVANKLNIVLQLG